MPPERHAGEKGDPEQQQHQPSLVPAVGRGGRILRADGS
jgi:hypothetical protein